MKFRWKRWTAGLVGVLAAYAALGFWGLPFLIERQLPRIAQGELARQASVGQVRFNPFTLRLEAADLRLTEADGAPLFGIGHLALQLEWRSILRRAWSFAEIRLAQPTANLLIASDGKFNLAELLDTLARRRGADSAEAGLPRLVIERFALERGKLEMQDRQAGYENVFTPIDFALAHFSTLPDQNDSHTFSAESAHGGKLYWKGTASVNPIRASGELALEDASLPDLAVYLKSYARATINSGRLSASLPYSLSYAAGKFEARLAGAKLSVADLAVAREGPGDPFARLARLSVDAIDADLARREVTVGGVRGESGRLRLARNAKGELDLAQLAIERAAPSRESAPEPAAASGDWKLAVAQLVLDDIALSAVDETVKPALTLDAGKARLQLQLQAGRAAAAELLTVAGAALSVDELTLASGGATPLKVARLGFEGGSFDLASRRVNAQRVFAEGGQLQLVRDRKGDLNLMQILPAAGAAGNEPMPAAAPGQPWLASVKRVEWSRFGAQVDDQGLGVKVNVNDFTGKLEDAGSDLKQPVRFSGALSLREGGQFAAEGSVVPASGALQADVRIKQLALAPLQPLLARHVKLKIAGGNVSAQGKLSVNSGNKAANMRYVGAVNVAGLTLNEQDGELFAAWKNVSADRLTATLGPDRIEVPELRIVEPKATLIIEPDRSFNAARLLVQPPAGAATTAIGAAPAAQPFPVQIRRVRLENAKLDFADLSLQPQFAAKIHELNGVINGLSSSRDARSQLELDGRVGEFGLARVRGELNPFAPSNNTDVNVVFKNVDLVPTSPYTMKFAGYRIAQGKISLDLQYKLRNRQLEGANQIVIDQLTLGERVESPDALKLPLALAIAILKDSDGRIDLGLPVSGDMSDPQFSYGAIIWKAIGNLLTKIVTAPFRALGALLGVSGEKLESIEFDPGSDKLLPPEREKIKQVAQLLAKRAQLKLSVPAQYSESADGAALRARAVRSEVARRAGLKLAAGEEPGPLDLGDRAVRVAVREFFAARFGDAELDKQKKAAEAAAAAPSGAASSAESAQAKLPIWQRVGKMIQGEPQVADAGAFYKNLLQRLNDSEKLDPQALAQLATNRSNAILALLSEAGVQPARAVATAPEKVSAEAGKPIHLKLSLGAS